MGHSLTLFLLAGLAGILALQQQPELPEGGLLCLISGIFIYFLLRYLTKRKLWLPLLLLAGLLTGFGWAAWRAEVRLATALNPAWEGQDVQVVGVVVSLPQVFERGTRFEFQVEASEPAAATVPERLWLSTYSGRPGYAASAELEDEASLRQLKPGERWRLTVRLKRPHGAANPGGFDYEAWLLERNLRATGYVRASPVPERLTDFSFWPPMGGVHRLRLWLREGMARQLGDAPYGGILTALVIGDQQAIDDRLWTIFSRTGTSHLFSISGLHITLIASLLGLLVNRLWRRHGRLCLIWPAQRAAILSGWLAALGYALLAGGGIPAQRTCWMLTVAALAMLSGRRVGVGRILLLALAGVLIPDPWAVLAPGFWLSFAAVAALVWIGQQGGGKVAGWRGWLREFGRTQWAATLATLPILLWVFQQFPLVSPLANLVAIPLVSFVITPLALLGALFIWIPGMPLLELAHWLLAGLMAGLEWGASLPLWKPPASELWAPILAGLGVFLLLLPRGVPGKAAGAVMLLPLLFWPRLWPETGTLRATVLDVGQGQAVLLETARHSLLYDAGPAYGNDDAGRRVVVPFLVGRGITALDMLVVSHKDADHAGGLASIRAALPAGSLVSSIPDLEGGSLCAQGQSWEWDGVSFAFLHPEAGRPLQGANGDSCVLRVASPSGRLLLTGDIEAKDELVLLNRDAASLSAEVLLLPHHGSTSSSSLPFVAAVGPELALASAGYRNRFKHPRPEVLERYEGLGTQVWRTDRDGALLLEFAGGRVALQAWRQTGQRYWWGR